MSVEMKNNVIKIIYEFLKLNSLLKKDHIEEIENILKLKENELFVLDFFEKNFKVKLPKILELCFKTEGLFTKEEYGNEIQKLNQLKEKLEKENSQKEIIKKKVKIEDQPTEKQSSSKIKEDIFTEEEIKSLINKGENLYKAIPGNKIPKKDNQFYVNTQLKRFIDSGGSDFIVETQKRNGMIYNAIKFKIAGTHETQDSTTPSFSTDESKGNQNHFFDTVRKYIGGSLGRMNADAKHIVQDSSFSLDYRNKQRDFRLSALPTRCMGIPYPRYCIRLTSEGDNIDFDKIELLPFMKDFYMDLINNKKPGMTAITGPTGSGKTTTIYGILNKIDKDKLSVLSVEKPIESQVHGINQTEEDAEERDDKKESFTNKDFMKSILRQAGDVLFVGEMRDAEETQQGVKTGLVGNKLITTFHTNSAVDTILRLKEEGVSNNAIGNGVKNITAQRLVQKVCTKCAVTHSDNEKYINKIRKLFNRSKVFFQVEMKKLLDSLSLEELNNIDMLEIHITDNLIFLSKKDIDIMIDLIDLNHKEFENIKTKAKKIDFLLELFKDFPNPKLRKYINKQIIDGKILEAYPKGCDCCKEGYLQDRIMIVEGLSIDKSIKRFIQDPDSKLIDLEKFILNKGFIDMRMYGYILVLQGITTLEKINEVVDE